MEDEHDESLDSESEYLYLCSCSRTMPTFECFHCKQKVQGQMHAKYSESFFHPVPMTYSVLAVSRR